MNARFQVPKPYNEPILDYAPGSRERLAQKERVGELKADQPDIPLYIGGKEVRTGKTADCRSPYDHSQKLGRYHQGGAKEVDLAIKAAMKAREDWARMPFHARAAIFLKAADLLAADWRWTLNAATMLCQSKSVHQAEIDSACELIDFYRYNVAFAEQIYSSQPENSRGMWNRLEQRPLEGFVFALTPFNFTAIAGNLPTAPAIMGNTVVWKPASSTVFTAHYLMKLWKAAGLPDGVINMVAGPGGQIGDPILASDKLAGIHFTGSTEVFHSVWKTVGDNIARYPTYPRLVGETGGKDFVMVHESADAKAVAAALVRGAFEFQGQKCSAASRAYVPDSMWPSLKKSLGEMIGTIKMGSPEDFTNFFNAVIDRPAYERIKGYIERAKKSPSCKILWGGRCDDSQGFFIEPTVIETSGPNYESMVKEIFGPVLTIYVYPARKFAETLKVCDRTSPYALTGSIFACDRSAILQATEALENAAGNFYINDKPTGAVVGQQPFGGARASGTNDKAGSYINLLRWVSPRTIKETFNPPHDYKYPFLQPEAAEGKAAKAPAAEGKRRHTARS
jgi:1-pyrroline-5-carboxylate dehydrogenase